MPSPWSDLDVLTAAWTVAVGDTVVPLGSGLRHAFPDRWVRFHTLPDGERVARTQGQQAQVRRRYGEVLRALGTPQVLITCGWDGPAGERPPGLAALMPAARWRVPGDGTTVYAVHLDDDGRSTSSWWSGWRPTAPRT